MIVLKRVDVASKYTAPGNSDPVVHAGIYKGPLSKITLEAADKLVDTGSNLLKAKEPLPPPSKQTVKPPASAEADQK